MRNILWLIAVVCIVLWILGLLGFGAGLAVGSLIHILLVVAIISVLFNIIGSRKDKY